MTAGSMCSTKNGSWEGENGFTRVVRLSHNILIWPRMIASIVWSTPLYYMGRDLYKPPVAGAISLPFCAYGWADMHGRRGNRSSDLRQRLAAISGMIRHAFC